MRKIWNWIRFGEIKETIKAYDGSIASEIEYRGRNNRIIGYWAYGYWDTNYLYKGR